MAPRHSKNHNRRQCPDCKAIQDIHSMEPLTIFGLFAVSAMLAFYALENLNALYVMCFAGACLLGSIYGFQGAWPFGIIEAIWAGVAARRWWSRKRA